MKILYRLSKIMLIIYFFLAIIQNNFNIFIWSKGYIYLLIYILFIICIVSLLIKNDLNEKNNINSNNFNN